MNKTCNACGGIFPATQRDGSLYFHACAPIPNAAYQPDPTKGPVNLQQTVERPGKVDQNILSVDPKTGIVTPVSAGLGIT